MIKVVLMPGACGGLVWSYVAAHTSAGCPPVTSELKQRSASVKLSLIFVYLNAAVLSPPMKYFA